MNDGPGGEQRGNSPPFFDSDVDPFPCIYEMFAYYNHLYFDNSLGGVSVEWSSKRMTLCGGTTQKVPGGAIIKLSQPLLSLRPVTDLKNVLLHEMIHAWVMVNALERQDGDPGGHGRVFTAKMASINASTVPDMYRPVAAGYNITVFHTMYGEVDHYRQHHWKCERCGSEVRRAMNRPPQPADCSLRGRQMPPGGCFDPRCRYHVHLRVCGGDYVKIKEPEKPVRASSEPQKRKKARVDETGAANRAGGDASTTRPITDFFKRPAAPNLQLPNHEDASNLTTRYGSTSIEAGQPPLASLAAVLANSAGQSTISTSSGVAVGGKTGPSDSVEERRRVLEAAALARQKRATFCKRGEETDVKGNEQRPPVSVARSTQLAGGRKLNAEQGADVVDLRNEPASAEATKENYRAGERSSVVLLPSSKVACPVCGAEFSDTLEGNALLNTHLDTSCLA
jgi:hypothetical protein